MKKFSCLLLVTTVLLGACSSYQYVSITSSLETGDNKEYVLENDTVVIKYAFSGYNCPVNIQITNKLSTPIYVDWSKSAIILSGVKYGYYTEDAEIRASSSSSEIRWSDTYSSSSSSISGTISKNERISFIPPNSRISKTPMYLRSVSFNLPPREKANRVNVYNFNGVFKGYKYSYLKNDSPLNFRSFLTLSIEETFSKPIFFDDEFWVDEIIDTRVDPNSTIREGNKFYLKKTSNAGTTLLGGLLLVIIILGAAAGG